MRRTDIRLLRHARVASHQGDMPLAEDAAGAIAAAVDRLAGRIEPGEDIRFLTTATRRSRETAEAVRAGLAARLGTSATLRPCRDSWALRNPDLYLAGERVEMVSTLDAFAAQIPDGEVSAGRVGDAPFFGGFVAAPDRIGFWLRHPSPPGETAADVARRLVQFFMSFRDLDNGRAQRHRIVCVSHSPVLRALLTEGIGIEDPGEPDWVEEVHVVAGDEAAITFRERKATLRLPDG